jgi:hypothetical protein
MMVNPLPLISQFDRELVAWHTRFVIVAFCVFFLFQMLIAMVFLAPPFPPPPPGFPFSILLMHLGLHHIFI